MKITDEMVSRFLGWSLPKDFGPDCGITFTPINHPNCWPVGTNLLTADQARQMLEHVLGGTRSETGERKLPAEPTRAMLDAWSDQMRGIGTHRPSIQWPSLHYSDSEALMVRAYQAMLNAAPQELPAVNPASRDERTTLQPGGKHPEGPLAMRDSAQQPAGAAFQAQSDKHDARGPTPAEVANAPITQKLMLELLDRPEVAAAKVKGEVPQLQAGIVALFQALTDCGIHAARLERELAVANARAFPSADGSVTVHGYSFPASLMPSHVGEGPPPHAHDPNQVPCSAPEPTGLVERIRWHQCEAARLMLEFTGDPMRGVGNDPSERTNEPR